MDRAVFVFSSIHFSAANMSTRNYLDKRYYIRRLDTGEGTFKDALEVCELSNNTFYGTSFSAYWYGEDFFIREEALNHINRTISDPRARLRNYIQSAINREKLIYSRAEALHQANLVCGDARSYALYDSKSPINRVVGYVSIDPPKAFGPAKRPLSIRTRIYALWLKAKNSISDTLRFLFYKEHPTNNARKERLMKELLEGSNLPENKTEVIDQLAALSPEEVKKVPYPADFMWYIGVVIISPDYQRQGIGKMMLQYCIDEIPRDIKPVFKSQDGKLESTGEIRLRLDGSVDGVPLYERLGFIRSIPKDHNTVKLDSYTVFTTPMYLAVS